MAAISQKINNLIGGVSQQPDSNKIPGQLRECVNFLPDPTFGLIKRPGLRAVKGLSNVLSDGTWFNLFKSDEEKYLCQIGKSGQIKVYDADSGQEQTVNSISSSAQAYATHTDASDIDLLQINDYTFFINRRITVTRDVTKSAAQVPYGYILINIVNYQTNYIVKLDSTTFTYVQGSTGQLSVDVVRAGILGVINANPAWVADGVGNVIRIRKANNTDFQISAEGGTAGDAIEAHKDVVSTIASLPREFYNNSIIRVATPQAAGPGFWLIFKTNGGTTEGSGVWEETLKPDEFLGLTKSTLPHVLIREANGTFTFRVFDEASAIATPATANVAGVANQVSVTTAGRGRYFTGQTFHVTGGTGQNLRLRVLQTTTTVNDTTPAYATNTELQWITFPDRQEYRWVVNGTLLRTTTTDSDFTIGETEYKRGSSYEAVTPLTIPGAVQQQRARIRLVTTRSGVVSLVEPSRGGQGYTASDVVTSPDGDTFTINTVSTVTYSVEAFAKLFWLNRTVGDTETAPDPSIRNSQITGISFFQNRLVLMSGENVICSKAGDYFNLYPDSAATVLDSDPIDLSCGSLLPIVLKHSIPSSRGLLLFSDNGQYVLETRTDAFGPATAELNLVSGYSMSSKIAPIDAGPTVMFLEESDSASMVFEMLPTDSRGSKSKPMEITRLVPYFVTADVREMRCSQTTGVLALTSRRAPNSIFMFRFFDSGDQRLMSAWFEWELPGEIVSMNFYHETLYVVVKSGANHVLCHLKLITDSPGGALFFDGKAIDVKIDYADYIPTTTYDTINNRTRVDFKPGLFVDGAQPIVVTTDPANPGVVFEPDMETSGGSYFVYVPGDFSSSPIVLGYRYTASALLPYFYFRAGEGSSADTLNVPTVHRLHLDSFESGPFQVLVKAFGRQEFDMELPQQIANFSLTNALPMVRASRNTIPIMARGDTVDVYINVNSPFPTSFTSAVWEGTYNNKGVRLT